MNKALDRLIIGVMSIGYLLFSLLMILAALGWTTPVYWVENALLYSANRWVLGIVGAIFFVAFLTLFISSFRVKPSKVSAVHETSLGAIRITLPALENLVLKSAQSVHGVRDVKPLLTNLADGLAVSLKVQVAPDINIPKVVEELQKTVKDYLAKTAGTTVKEIHVSVTKISWETKSRVE